MNDFFLTPDKTVDPVARLRGLIRRKTTEKQRFQKDMEQLDATMGPLREAARENAEVDRQVHERFEQAMAKPGLSKAKRKQVRELYEELQRDGLLTPPPDEGDPEGSCPCPTCTAARAARAEGRQPGQPEWGDAEAGAAGFSGAPFEGRPSAHADHVAAAKPDRDKGLRALYHKLARQYHPDRAEDDAERAAHGDVMRQVNDAYHSGDTQRLLELSRELGVDVDGLVGGAGLLQELVQQYENLKAEIRAMRASFLGMVVLDTRRAARQRTKPPVDMLFEAELELGKQLRRIRDFVGDFVDGKVSLKELMEGPPLDLEDFAGLEGFEGLEDVDPDDVDLLRAVFGGGPAAISFDDVMGMIEEAARSMGAPRPRGPRAKAKSKKRKPPSKSKRK